MKGTFFRLKFFIKIYDGKHYQQEGTYVISNPIEIFSHSQYLSSASSRSNFFFSFFSFFFKSFIILLFSLPDPAPPIVKEILPPQGTTNTRVVILGNNFIKNAKLVVKFDNAIVSPEFHEQGTLVCNAPPHDGPPGAVRVSVANDSIHFCKTQVTFTYT